MSLVFPKKNGKNGKKLIQTAVLDNGFTIYSVKRAEWNFGMCGIRTGSGGDPLGNCGLAHFVEHLKSHKTRKYSSEDIEWYYERYYGGYDGDAMIATSYHYTTYGQSDLLYRRYLTPCFELNADMLRSFSYRENIAKAEKAAVLNEYHIRGKESYEILIFDLLHKKAFGKHPFSRRIDCDPDEILKNIHYPQVRGFVSAHYVPENSYAILLGLSQLEAVALAKKHFDDWPATGYKPPAYPKLNTTPLKKSPDDFKEKPRTVATHVCLGYPTVPYGHPDSVAIHVLTRIWAWRSRMVLRNSNPNVKAGTYRVLPYTCELYPGGYTALWSASQSKVFALNSIPVMQSQALRLAEDMVTEKEFDAVRLNLRDQYRNATRNYPQTLGSWIAEASSNRDYELSSIHTYIDQLMKKLNRKKLKKVAEKYFAHPGNIQVVLTPKL